MFWQAALKLYYIKEDTHETHVIGRPGSDLLSRALRQSTIGAEAFHGRVRNGIGCRNLAITTRSANYMSMKLVKHYVRNKR